MAAASNDGDRTSQPESTWDGTWVLAEMRYFGVWGCISCEYDENIPGDVMIFGHVKTRHRSIWSFVREWDTESSLIRIQYMILHSYGIGWIKFISGWSVGCPKQWRFALGYNIQWQRGVLHTILFNYDATGKNMGYFKEQTWLAKEGNAHFGHMISLSLTRSSLLLSASCPPNRAPTAPALCIRKQLGRSCKNSQFFPQTPISAWPFASNFQSITRRTCWWSNTQLGGHYIQLLYNIAMKRYLCLYIYISL